MSPGESVNERSRRQARRRLVLLAAVAAAGAVVGALLVQPIHDELTERVWALGPAAPAGFVLGYAVLSLLLVPGSVLSVLAGVLFGALWGTVLAFAGGVLGSISAFLVGRRLGRGAVERLTGERLRKVDQWLADHGVLALAVVRIVPAMPYSLLNYAAGLTGIPFSRYVKGSLLGLVPGAAAYASLGGTLHNPLSLPFVGAVALIAVVLLAGTVAERRLSRRR